MDKYFTLDQCDTCDYNKNNWKNAGCILAIESKYIDSLLCKVFIGYALAHEFILVPGTVQWIFNGCPILPAGFCYHNVRIELYNIYTNEKISKNITIFYIDRISNELRCDIGNHGYSCEISNNYYFVAMFGEGCVISKDREKYKRKIHFKRRPPLVEDYDRRRKLDFINKIRKELIEKAYHPSRYYNWCLDEDAKKAFIGGERA